MQKKKRVFLWMGICLAALCAGCGGGQAGVAGTGIVSAWQRLPEERPVDAYLEEIEKLSGAVGELVEAGQEFVSLGDADPEDQEGLAGCVERMRLVKEAFLKFSEEVQPPEELAKAHAKMAEAVSGYAELIDVYCDVLLAGLEGEEHPEKEELQDEWEEMGASVSEAMEEVRRAVASLPSGQHR